MDGSKNSKSSGASFRLALLITLAALLTGCQFGRLSMSMSDFHGVPLPRVQLVPEQWEPELKEE